MRKIKNTAIIALAGLFFCSQIALAQIKHDMPAGESKVAEGIKATLVVTPSKSMVDLVLVGAKNGKTITTAKVAAQIKGPDGKVQEKELLGMQMGEVFFGEYHPPTKASAYQHHHQGQQGNYPRRINNCPRWLKLIATKMTPMVRDLGFTPNPIVIRPFLPFIKAGRVVKEGEL